MAEGELSPGKEQQYRNELKVLHTEVEKHKSDGIITEEEKEKTKTELSKLLRAIQEELGPDKNHDLYGQITGLAQSVAEFRKKQKTEKKSPTISKQDSNISAPVKIAERPKENKQFGVNAQSLPEYPPAVKQKPREEEKKAPPSIAEIIEKNTIRDNLDLRKLEVAQILQILDFLTKAKKIPGNITKIYIQKSIIKGHEHLLEDLSDEHALLILNERGELLYGRIITKSDISHSRENKDTKSLSTEDEAELRKSVGEFHGDKREKDRQNSDTFNRTFPGRLNDHIAFLKEQLQGQPTYFIDIGPGVGDFQDKTGKIQREYPAITSLEMAQAFGNNHVIALDLSDSINTLNKARRQDPKIGADLLSREDMQIVGGDGMKPLGEQLKSLTDIYKKPIRMPGENEAVVIRACNSIDIYFEWGKLQPVIEKMGKDFEKHKVILFFGRKILRKEQGSSKFQIIGEVSNRGFNHNDQTTKHVPAGTPPYTLRKSVTSVREKTTTETSNLPESALTFFEELDTSGDKNLIQTSKKLQEKFAQMDTVERAILAKSTPHMHVMTREEVFNFYSKYGNQKSSTDYQILVDIHETGQKAYLVDPSGVPQLTFDISSGRGSLTPTGNYSIKTREEDLRTIPYTRFGQAYKLWGKRGMLNWDSGAQMTTAILSMDTPGNIYFHGTNKEKNLGAKDSGGCIRMDNISIAFLSELSQLIGIRDVKIVAGAAPVVIVTEK